MRKKWMAVFAVLCLTALLMGQASMKAKEPIAELPHWYKMTLELAAAELPIPPDLSPEAMVTNEEWVTILANIFELKGKKLENFPRSDGAMAAALDKKWYDWDEIPPTGERYNQPIQRQVAVKIAVNAMGRLEQGLYDSWYSRIADANALDGRYYDSTFSAYEAGIVTLAQSKAFRPADGLNRKEANQILKQMLASTGKSAQITKAPETQAALSGTAEMGGVAENGALQVVGTQLCNAAGAPVVLRGMSSHGMQWYPQFATYESIKTTKDYGANLFRVAMYTKEGGYLDDPGVLQAVIQAVDAATALDMYAIIDWHILSDNNPMQHINEAKAFFAEMAERYKDNPGVLYEICNEPNGATSWQGDIYPYADAVIPVIRDISPNAVIIVGTEQWSSGIGAVQKKPLPYENLMYSYHLYTGSSNDTKFASVLVALESGTPVFVSEWGVSKADGGSGASLDEAQRWIEFMDAHNLSWANWSLCNKDESSAAIKHTTAATSGWILEDLSDSGAFIFQRFRTTGAQD